MPRPAHKLLAFAVASALAAILSPTARAQSVFTQKPDDARAVVVTPELFGVKGDGVADDSDGLQNAFVQGRGNLVLLPEGRYRITKTVYVPVGTRVMGFGKNRPVIFLAPNSPGFQEPGKGYPFGDGKYMIHYAVSKAADGAVTDASELDFNSAMNNVDFEIGDGNPSAVCVRFHIAQHSYLSNMNFKLGTGLAALEDIGNQASNLKISGGKFGIISTRTSPNWQFLLMDSTFDGQSVAGVRTQDVGFSFIRCNFSHMPVAIQIPEGQTDQIYGRDLRFEDIKDMGVKFGDYLNFKHEITLENTACADVPHFVAGTEKVDAPGKFYMVDHLAAGLEIGSDGREVGVVTRHKEHALQAAAPVVPSDIPPLPPMDQWFTVTADTDLQQAVNDHKILYFPMGNYRANGTLTLKADTVLIGLHCTRTSVGAIESPKGGAPFVTGVQCSSVHWMSGEKSVMDDIAFGGGGGFGRGQDAPSEDAGIPVAAGGGAAGAGGAAGGARGGGGAGRGRGAGNGAGYITISDGGGGIFRNLWVESGPGGMRVENTSTPGIIYQLSNEHHNGFEVGFRNVQNWQINDLQTEEESGQQNTYSLDIQDCQNLLFANTYQYRVSRTTNPKTYGNQVRNSDNIVFDNIHVFSQTRIPFDNTVVEEGSGVMVRDNNFTHLVVSKSMKKGDPLPLPAAFEKGATLEKLADGFSNATSLTADDEGRVYFTDSQTGKIFRWNDADKKADLLATVSGNNQPQVMGFVKPSTLLVAAFAPGARQVGAIGTVDTKTGQLAAISENAEPKPGTSLLLPVGIHNRMDIMQDYMNHVGYDFRSGSNTSVIRVVQNEHRGYFYPPDSNVALMAGGTGRPVMQACQLEIVAPGQTFFMTSEDDCQTWQASLDKDLKLTAKLFAERGGTSVVADADGNVYIAGGDVYIYDKTGKQIGTLETPERASSLAFGGPDMKTLFIGARGSFLSIRTAAPGK